MNVLTVGSAMIDTIAVIASDRIEQVSMRNADTSFLMLQEGSKTDATEVSTHCGGGAINTAVAFARLGHEVATIVRIGRDQRADVIRQRLHDEGISARWIVNDEKVPTGASVMVSSGVRTMPSGCLSTSGAPYGSGRPRESRGRALRARPDASRSREGA